MKLDLFLLLIISGVPVTFSFQKTTRVLYLIKKSVTWAAAQKYCRTMYTDLARDKDSIILPELGTMAESGGLTTFPVWIGLYNDFDGWRWSFNSLSLQSTTLTNWLSGKPDNFRGKQACGIIYSSGYWDDDACTDLKTFICYNAGNSGAGRFVGVNNPQLTWTDAQTYCRTFHTDLASALNQADNDLLAQVASVQGTSWFGLYRDTWKWLNGTVASNLKWNPGQPDNTNPPENCGALLNSTIVDRNCDCLHNFFCELVSPIRRKIIKLHVKSDATVFHPAVQFSVLELIKRKLEEHGMLMNTTVTWRVQPNGNIFGKKKNT